ncbi:ABC transporter ATP-binding protein [Cryobacterium frigoriphilum]|uniref:ABC transporter ATP-binding protein n=1 Tax=Cryobacterium frigoriphilum TaxID=1259150 RepID=UPI001F53F166|nr:ABC transporter ATP-binding protein [Cryobacterium frigoriphilum]
MGFGYPGRPLVFRDVSLHLPDGSITAVLGPNGSGKTTLVRCAAGLLPVHRGSVHRRTAVGYVPQARGSSFAYRAFDMVLMGRARHVQVFRTPGAGDRAAALLAMERVGIAALRDRSFSTLSGGEQQLVLIARAVAAETSLLILDEPSTGLDLKNQVRVLRLLRELAADGMGLLLSTHEPDHALYLADTVVLLHPGQAQVGPAAELLTEVSLSRLYGVRVSVVAYVDSRIGSTDGSTHSSANDSAPRSTIVTHYDDSATVRHGEGTA